MQIPGQFCVQINTASYASAGAGVTVSLALATAQNTGTASGTDTLTTIENLTGSAFGDVLTGGTTANRIEGGAGNASGVGPNKACITEGQIQREEMRLLLHAADHHHRLAEVGLCVAGGMSQWHKHLAASTTMFTDVILDRRVAALEAVLVP